MCTEKDCLEFNCDMCTCVNCTHWEDRPGLSEEQGYNCGHCRLHEEIVAYGDGGPICPDFRRKP